MPFTTVTVTGKATFPNGDAISGAIVSFVPDRDFVNSASHAAASETYSATDGTWSTTVNATDDTGTVPLSGRYVISTVDPSTGEVIERFRAPVSKAPTPTTITALHAFAQ